MEKFKENQKDIMDEARVQSYDGSILKELHALSGAETLDRILEHPDPSGLIQGMTNEDFFWLTRKVGNDSLQLLRLASLRQWQYLLDLDLWAGDRLDMPQAFLWLQRLQRADPRRLVGWLFSDSRALAYYYLYKNVRVELRDEDEAYDLEKGFITLDGLYYVKVVDRDQRETIEGILRTMADEDLLKYQSFLLGLAGVLPAELEEEMYRLRNVRMAEHGFLPREEALMVYAPLEPDILERKEGQEMVDRVLDEESLSLAPYMPFHEATGRNVLTKTASKIADPVFLDRIRLEFAGLCNQLISADGWVLDDLDVLRKAGLKAAGYLNLTLETMCGRDLSAAENLLKNNPIISLFRIGFGLAQKLKWKTERWVKGSWFDRQGLGYGFWGDEWGNTLSGLLKKRPQYYCGPTGDREYRDFEQASDLETVGTILDRLMVLDRLLGRLTEPSPLGQMDPQPIDLTFHSLLFTVWGRQMLHLRPSYEGLSLKEAKKLFDILRAGDERPPYQMLGFEEVFLKDHMAFASGFEDEDAATLRETLTLIWQAFCREYDWVPADALDPRFSHYLLIRPSSRPSAT